MWVLMGVAQVRRGQRQPEQLLVQVPPEGRDAEREGPELGVCCERYNVPPAAGHVLDVRLRRDDQLLGQGCALAH